MRLIFLIVSLMGVFGCQQLGQTAMTLDAKSGQSTVYPVDPSVHDSQGNVHGGVREQVTPTITNAVAYTRYAMELSGYPTPANPAVYEMAIQMAENGNRGLPIDVVRTLGSVRASESTYADQLRHIEAEARQLSTPTLPRQGRDILDGYAKLQTCQSFGHSAQDCCASLLWLEGFRADEAQDDSWNYLEQTEATLDRLISESDESEHIHPFRQSGVRAWLTYCGPKVTDSPNSLTEFKARFGDYHWDGDWTKEFHPLSPAKQAGRRIFRKVLWDGTQVSVAESTRDDCSVLETETIVKTPGEQAQFWVFQDNEVRGDHAFFPTRRAGEDAVKFAPNTCMGCHYTLDTREFKVVAPSFTALNLTLFETDGVRVWRDHSHCIESDDTLVHHDL